MELPVACERSATPQRPEDSPAPTQSLGGASIEAKSTSYGKRRQLRLFVQRAPKPKQVEAGTQAALVAWANVQRLPASPDVLTGAYYGDYLHAIPNGGFRNIREAVRLKAQGVKAGVWDLFFPLPRIGFHGLYLETKANNNTLTEGQEDWGARMGRAGFALLQFYEWTDARDALVAYANHDLESFTSTREIACKPSSKR